MIFCSPARYDSNAVYSLGVGRVKDETPAHCQKVDPLLAVVPPIINPLDGKRITECHDSLMECVAMPVEICGCLFIVPFKIACHPSLYWLPVVSSRDSWICRGRRAGSVEPA